MKITLTCLVISGFFTGTLIGQNVRLHIIDETGAPVENARATISYVLGSTSDDHIGLTDHDGFYSAQGQALVGIYLEASKEGYYSARFDSSRSDRLPPGPNIEKLLVLPHVVKPIALYANYSYDPVRGHSLKIPSRNKWIGYDFETSDWVQPYGKGIVTDIQFRFHNSFLGYDDHIKDLNETIASSKRAYAARHEEWTEEEFKVRAGKWDGVLEISFPSEQEGLREEKDRFLSYSKLKLPREAPADEYQPTWRYSINSYSPTTLRDNVGFFIRTRVKLDKNGNIVSANFAKILGDFHFSPANGGIRFLYYFNPVPNDRNLEFDPKRNLFPTKFPGANVGDP
jgi:hypothetical protein